MDKGLRLSNVLAARSLLQQAGIRACYFLQFGYPGETWSDILQTVDLIRSTRPSDIGVSFSYPLPGTVFYERVRAQLGAKRNWTHSDDLCLMFKATYTDNFYRTLRDALHAEVDSWRASSTAVIQSPSPAQLWQKVVELEPVSRNRESTTLDTLEGHCSITDTAQFVSLARLTSRSSEI